MEQLTTLEKVFDRVDAMSANCYDLNVDVPDIFFDNLDVLRIAGRPHPVRPVAQRSISNRLGIPYPYLVPIQKRGILVEIKACEKFYHRYIVDIPRIKF